MHGSACCARSPQRRTRCLDVVADGVGDGAAEHREHQRSARLVGRARLSSADRSAESASTTTSSASSTSESPSGSTSSSSLGLEGADYLISAIGPAFEVFGKYSSVQRLNGDEVTVGELLALARRTVARHAMRRLLGSEALAAVDDVSLFYLTWRWAYGAARIPVDEAQKLGKAFNVEVERTRRRRRPRRDLARKLRAAWPGRPEAHQARREPFAGRRPSPRLQALRAGSPHRARRGACWFRLRRGACVLGCGTGDRRVAARRRSRADPARQSAGRAVARPSRRRGRRRRTRYCDCSRWRHDRAAGMA